MQIASRLSSPTNLDPPRRAPSHLSRLRLDPGCSNRANWCCEIDTSAASAGSEGSAVTERMLDLGYRSKSRHPALKVFRKPDGRELAWVVSSGRVQIRVPMAVDPDQRETAAGAVWRDLRSCLLEGPP